MRRLLIIGCGDVALRALPQLCERYRIYALTHNRARAPLLRSSGVVPIVGDLDDPASLGGLTGLAHDVLHSAPPPPLGARDTRTSHLIATLAKAKSLPQHLVYISTSGVYGDCAGALVDETRALHPQTARAQRRVDAERQLRDWGRRSRVRISILRAPGIYSAARLPVKRLEAGVPALRADEDGYSNHVHADDLARMAVAALRFGYHGRMYNASDDSVLKMGDYFDLVADHCGLPRPPRLSRAEASERMPSTLLSFMNESRRLSNQRLKTELRFKLRYPTVRDGIAAIEAAPGARTMNALIVITNAPDRAVADKIARALIDRKLAACVNILAECSSVYRWQGNVETAAEVPLLIKTRADIFPEVEAAIKSLHPYELPEIVGVPVAHGSSEYLDWINAATVTEIG